MSSRTNNLRHYKYDAMFQKDKMIRSNQALPMLRAEPTRTVEECASLLKWAAAAVAAVAAAAGGVAYSQQYGVPRALEDPREVLRLGDALQDHDHFERWSAREIVERYDNNEDGKLSFEELNTAIKEQGFNVTITEAVFDAMDNGDRYGITVPDEIHNGALTATEIENAAGNDELIENLVIVEDPETGGHAISFQDDERPEQDWLDAERLKDRLYRQERERIKRQEDERREKQRERDRRKWWHERERRARQAGGEEEEEEEEEASAPARAPVEEDDDSSISYTTDLVKILGLGYAGAKMYEEYKELTGKHMTPKDLAIAEGLKRAVDLKTFHREAGEIVPNDDTECPVCFETLEDKEWIIRRCGHAFCKDCASQFGINCPLCRRTGADFDPDSDLRIYRMQGGVYANLRF